MESAPMERRRTVSLPQEEFEAMLERAAERGARHALSEVGLDGPEAAHDIRELRSLLDAYNAAKRAIAEDTRASCHLSRWRCHAYISAIASIAARSPAVCSRTPLRSTVSPFARCCARTAGSNTSTLRSRWNRA